jgi:hypothetical protein
MPERKLIYADTVVEKLSELILLGDYEKQVINLFVDQCMAVDAVPVAHGRWEQARYTEAPLYICAECDKPEYKQHRYCPNCGAKMDGVADG